MAHPCDPLASGDGLVLSGRIDASGAGQGWLREHQVFGTVLLPGTALLDMVLTAAERVGAAGVDTLTLSTPLVLPDHGSLRVQVAVTGTDDTGRRQATVHTHPDPEAEPGTPWTTHATAQLTDRTAEAAEEGFRQLRDRPAAGGTPVELDGFYERLRELGIDYGPAFRGLAELTRDGDTAHAVVRLPEAATANAAAHRFAVHPALLDAALHAIGALDPDTDQVTLPFEWAAPRCTPPARRNSGSGSSGSPPPRTRYGSGPPTPTANRWSTRTPLPCGPPPPSSSGSTRRATSTASSSSLPAPSVSPSP
ncbi:polyketide synthase dehydratase domain-containing protein [Actinomadura keratinilytica]